MLEAPNYRRDRPKGAPLDPLSDLLALLKPQNYMSAGFDAGGDWAVRFPGGAATIKTGAVVSGVCWLLVEGEAGTSDTALRLTAGDCFVLPSGRPFRFASDSALPPVPAAAVFPRPTQGGIIRHQGGGDCFLVSSRFSLAEGPALHLLGLLPPIVHLRDGGGALRFAVERMIAELRDPAPGGVLLLRHLAHMMLVEALRLHLAASAGGTGWLAALADARVGGAVAAIHAAPARRWTVADLAQAAGMSRSNFAERFRTVVGLAPMDYVTRWRMALAADRLGAGEAVAAVAAALGYASESAFSAAFKREMAASPRTYRRRGGEGRVPGEPGADAV